MKVLWIAEGRTARDETAFRYILATAHRLRAAGKRMSGTAIIDSYERAYAVAQAVGADGRNGRSHRRPGGFARQVGRKAHAAAFSSPRRGS